MVRAVRPRRLSFVIRIWIRSEECRQWTGQVALLPTEERKRTVTELDDIAAFVGEVLSEHLGDGPAEESER